MTELEELPTTKSGAIKKQNAMKWLNSLDEPDKESMKKSIVAKPYHHTGSTYAEDISTIRLTGDAEFITEVAKMFKWMIEFERALTRLEINLKQLENDDGELTDNYALYLSAAERGG